MKLKTIYICENCGANSPKWMGKCPDCDAWNSFQEDVIKESKARTHKSISQKPVSIIHADSDLPRIPTSLKELDRVLGGGITEGSVTLLSGEPGIGKSTITLKVCEGMADSKDRVLYISGEESAHQISSRAKRMGVRSEKIGIITETNLENIISTLESEKPGFAVIDSIQVISSAEIPSLAGSINQVRYSTEALTSFAKNTNTPVMIIGHVTKDGNLAGPKILEHLVDTVLLIEGDRFQNFRIIRGTKNRYGSVSEIGLFEMTEKGLEEVKNPSKIFLEGRKEGSFGSAITATVEGTRPLLIEVQALTNISHFGYPKRAASGYDVNRLQLLIAVIQKHVGLNLSNQDVYINIVGGYRLNDPASDLAVAMAIISSFKKIPLPHDAIYIGELGLAGETRAVSNLGKRISEAAKAGFKKAYIPKSSEKITAKDIQVEQIESIISKQKTL
jgi:DNA repair protein RadA/Sms